MGTLSLRLAAVCWEVAEEMILLIMIVLVDNGGPDREDLVALYNLTTVVLLAIFRNYFCDYCSRSLRTNSEQRLVKYFLG